MVKDNEKMGSNSMISLMAPVETNSTLDTLRTPYEGSAGMAIESEMPVDMGYESGGINADAIESDNPATPVSGYVTKLDEYLPAIESELDANNNVQVEITNPMPAVESEMPVEY